MTSKNRLLLDGLVFPEAPRWHEGKLWFVDVHAHRICTCDESGQSALVVDLDDKPSGLGFLPDGTLLAALMRSRRIVRIEQERVSTHADLNSLPWHELNDMVADGLGRVYVGTKADLTRSDDPLSAPSTLVLVRADASFSTVATDLQGPNGIVITPDGKTLIVAETRAKRLTAFRISPDGSLSNRRIFADLGTAPDGICLDAEGCVWVGTVWANAFVRVRDGGEVMQRVMLEDGKWAVACILGGPERRTLYMLTAHQSLENLRRMIDFQADLTSASKGYIECVTVPVPGAGWP